jgi:hypothetical protein
MRSRALGAWPVWAALAGTALALVPRLNIVGLHEDEGVVSAWAALFAGGQVPYRDFFAFATPGSILLYGAEYRLLGLSLLSDRILTALGILLAVALLALIARRFLPAPWAAAVALLWGAWLPVFLGYSQYHFWAVTFCLACALALLEAAPGGRPGAWLLAGAAAGLAFLFLQAFVTVGLAALLLACLAKEGRFRRVGLLATGAAIPGGVVLAYLLATGSFLDFLRDTAGFTVGTYRSFNRVPFPWNPLLLQDTLNWRASEAAYWGFGMLWLLGIVLPIAVAAYAAWGLWKSVRGAGELSPAVQLAIISVALFGSVLLGRVGGPLAWLAAPLALVLLATRLEWTTRGRWQLAALVPVIALFLFGLSPAPVGWALSCSARPGAPLVAVAMPAGMVCVTARDAPMMRQAVSLAAAVPAHRVAFLPTSLELYELTLTRPIGPPLWLLPGLSSPDLVAKQEDALVAPQVERLLYIEDRDLDVGHPWAFDDFLAANFVLDGQGRGYRVYRRR